ncbi:MAG: hypothetical protein LBV53_00875 [Mycoplasmataceae bacterium]|nr:hypothetical protein [Mycoplasmataceae bacterium]
MASGNTQNSSTLKVLSIILSIFFWLPGLIVIACCKNNMTNEDYETSRIVCIVMGFLCLIIPGVIALLVLTKKK